MPFFNDSIHWLAEHALEIIAVITGILYIFFTIREKIYLWFFGIVSSGLYVWIFYKSGIYAYASLYIYYVVIGIYGWYTWGKKADDDSGRPALQIRHVLPAYLAVYLAAVLILIVPVYLVLTNFTDSDMPLADAFLTSGGMIATWMLTRKYIEQWLMWIVINMVSLTVMILKGLYPSSVLFAIYTLMAVKGYLEWRKQPARHE